MTPREHEEHRGYGPVADALERAQCFLERSDPQWAGSALAVLDAAAQLIAEEGPRGDGARLALAYHGGQARLEELRNRASALESQLWTRKLCVVTDAAEGSDEQRRACEKWWRVR